MASQLQYILGSDNHIRQNVCGKNFYDFHRFSINCKCFSVNHDLVDQKYKSTKMLQQKKLPQIAISRSKRKSFPPWMICHNYMVCMDKD